MNIGSIIISKRKMLGYTQQMLADKLHVSYQAVSKWENGTTCPDIDLLPDLACILGVSMDALFGYRTASVSEYEERYQTNNYYWGITPNSLCYEIMKMRPPVRPLRVLDIGCGEGKDAVFMARNGYIVSAFDVTESGIEKGKSLAEQCGVYVDFFKADLMDYRLSSEYDIIYSSGTFHYIAPDYRDDIMQNLKSHTNQNGLNVINVFVKKPFIEKAPDAEADEKEDALWKSGELFLHYHDWLLHKTDEVVFDCNSGGRAHKHCMDIMIAEKI